MVGRSIYVITDNFVNLEKNLLSFYYFRLLYGALNKNYQLYYIQCICYGPKLLIGHCENHPCSFKNAQYERAVGLQLLI